jgi:predicted nucleotidyltransferase
MISRERIQNYADRIAEAFHPERIILFGSYAYGAATKDSDVDLLVVMPAQEQDTKEAIKIRRSLRAGFPPDLLVNDPAYLQHRAGMEELGSYARY